MTKYGMVINTVRCIGCQTCSFACKMENNVPAAMRWSRVVTEDSDMEDGSVGVYPNLSRTYIPLACQHCENPACEKVCPTGATYKDDNGVVLVDYNKCIGCRMCMGACPYNVRQFNWNEPLRYPDFNYGDKDVAVRNKGVVEKCTFCHERTERGEEPMCVICCPTRARTFGDLDDPNSEVSKLIVERKATTLLPEKGTRPQVYYIR